MAINQNLPATDSAADLHELIGDDATATFENDPKFVDSNPTGDSSSENLQTRSDRQDIQNSPSVNLNAAAKTVDDDEEDEDDEYEDVETEDDDDEDEDDDDEDDDDEDLDDEEDDDDELEDDEDDDDEEDDEDEDEEDE